METFSARLEIFVWCFGHGAFCLKGTPTIGLESSLGKEGATPRVSPRRLQIPPVEPPVIVFLQIVKQETKIVNAQIRIVLKCSKTVVIIGFAENEVGMKNLR